MFKDLKSRIIKALYKRIVHKGMLDAQRKKMAEYEIMEDYLTDLILKGNEERRKELTKMQAEMVVLENLIKFLKK